MLFNFLRVIRMTVFLFIRLQGGSKLAMRDSSSLGWEGSQPSAMSPCASVPERVRVQSMMTEGNQSLLPIGIRAVD